MPIKPASKNFPEISIIQIMFSGYSAIKLKINNRKIIRRKKTVYEDVYSGVNYLQEWKIRIAEISNDMAMAK